MLESVAKTGLLVTVEEHSICGGLGSSAAETLGEVFPVAIKRIGMEDCFGESGPYALLLEKYGISTDNIVKQAKRLLKMKGREDNIMKESIHTYFQIGTIEWMSYPPERYPFLDSLKNWPVIPFYSSGIDPYSGRWNAVESQRNSGTIPYESLLWRTAPAFGPRP